MYHPTNLKFAAVDMIWVQQNDLGQREYFCVLLTFAEKLALEQKRSVYTKLYHRRRNHGGSGGWCPPIFSDSYIARLNFIHADHTALAYRSVEPPFTKPSSYAPDVFCFISLQLTNRFPRRLMALPSPSLPHHCHCTSYCRCCYRAPINCFDGWRTSVT